MIPAASLREFVGGARTLSATGALIGLLAAGRPLIAGPSRHEERLIGGNVVTMAHLFGTLAVFVHGFAFGSFRRGDNP